VFEMSEKEVIKGKDNKLNFKEVWLDIQKGTLWQIRASSVSSFIHSGSY